jgi:thioredoxin-like negative regulator of GroEL
MLTLDEGSAEEQNKKEEYALSLGARSIPYLIYFVDGEQVNTSLGVLSKEQIMLKFVTT